MDIHILRIELLRGGETVKRIIMWIAFVLSIAMLAACQQPGNHLLDNCMTAPETTRNDQTQPPTEPPLTTVLPATSAQTDYDLDEPYVYPVLPGSDEWEAMTSVTQKIDACQIPEDILCRLTTRALLETVLDYPLMVNMHSYSNMEMGYDAVVREFNGLRELVSRPDALAVIEAFSFDGTKWADAILIHSALNAITQYGLTYYIDEVYVYPVTTGTEAELLEACQVPEDILSHMETDALIFTVVNHPLITKVLEEDFDQTAYEELKKSINCLAEMDSRGGTVAMRLIGHASDPYGAADYALAYCSDVMLVLFEYVAN